MEIFRLLNHDVVGVGGNHDNGDHLVDLANLLEHFDAVYLGHLEIEKHDVDLAALDGVNAALAVGGRDHLVTLRLHPERHRFEKIGLVVYEKDPDAFRHVR